MFGRVLLIHVGFLLGTFLVAFPVAAALRFQEVEGGEIGPLGAGEFLDHELHVLVVHFGVKAWIFDARGRARVYVASLDLPEDVGGTIEAFAGKIGLGEVVVDAVVKAAGVVGGAAASAALAGDE